MSSLLPEGYTLRAVEDGDADTVAALMNAFEEHFGTGELVSGADVRSSWRDLVAPEGVAELVLAHGGEPAAYLERFPHRGALNLDGYVLPAHQGRGLGSAMAALGEARARELGLPKVKTGTLAADQPATAVFEQAGWTLTRAFFRMAIDLRGDEVAPPVPDGFVLRTFERGDGPAFHAAREEAFADHWDFAPEPYEEFERRAIDAVDFDPSLWLLVLDDDEVAAVLRATRKRFESGWIDALGVRPRWRKRGLGELLLRTSFAEFARRGEPRVALGVDAQNPTGATRRYERVGMHVAFRSNVFMKDVT
jgi:mycothiol synthase